MEEADDIQSRRTGLHCGESFLCDASRYYSKLWRFLFRHRRWERHQLKTQPIVQVERGNGHQDRILHVTLLPSSSFYFSRIFAGLCSSVTLYFKEQPNNLRQAMESMRSQTVPMDDFVKDEDNLTMRVEFETLSGEKLTYEYYRYSTRRCASSSSTSISGRQTTFFSFIFPLYASMNLSGQSF